MLSERLRLVRGAGDDHAVERVALGIRRRNAAPPPRVEVLPNRRHDVRRDRAELNAGRIAAASSSSTTRRSVRARGRQRARPLTTSSASRSRARSHGASAASATPLALPSGSGCTKDATRPAAAAATAPARRQQRRLAVVREDALEGCVLEEVEAPPRARRHARAPPRCSSPRRRRRRPRRRPRRPAGPSRKTARG